MIAYNQVWNILYPLINIFSFSVEHDFKVIVILLESAKATGLK